MEAVAMVNGVYDELATPLGHLVIAFNRIEIAMTLILMMILNQDEKAGAAFASLAFSKKFDRLKAILVKIEDAGVRKQLSELLDRANEVNKHRNHLVHSEYTAVLGDDHEVLVFLHQRLRDFPKDGNAETAAEIFKHIKPIDPEEVISVASDAATVVNDLLVFSEKFKA